MRLATPGRYKNKKDAEARVRQLTKHGIAAVVKEMPKSQQFSAYNTKGTSSRMVKWGVYVK